MIVFQCDLCGNTYPNQSNSASVRSGDQRAIDPSSEFVHICAMCRQALGLLPVFHKDRKQAKKALINLLKRTLRTTALIEGTGRFVEIKECCENCQCNSCTCGLKNYLADIDAETARPITGENHESP